MKKKYNIFHLFNSNTILCIVFFFTIIANAQQNVFSRSDSGTNLWWNDTQKPWYYQTWNSIENRSDIWPVGTRNNVFIGHNNNLNMIVNGAFFQLRTLTIQSSASSNRSYATLDNGGISLSVGYYKQLGSGNQNFNVPIGIDATEVTFSAQDGNTTFSNNFFLNSNNALFEGVGNFTVSGIIQGVGGRVTKNGSGTLILSGTNTYTGLTTINAGTIQFDGSNGNTIPSTNTVTVNSNSTLRISSNQILNVLNLNGGTLQIDAGVTLTVTTLNNSSGTILGPGNLITTPVITSSLSSVGSVGSHFSHTITANYSPLSFDATGLPLGLSIDTTTGLISGIPLETGVFNTTINVSNAVGSTTRTLEISILPVISLNAIHCGSTVTPYQWMFVRPVLGATAYRFNIYDSTGSTLLFSIDRDTNFFRFVGSDFNYGSTYQVKVQPKQGSVLGIEGSSCSVTLERIPSTLLNISQCGSVISPYQWLFASQVARASEYRFNVYDASGSTLLFSVNRNVPYFRFFGNSFTYGTTYQVRVQAKQGEVYGDEGSSCNVTLQNVPTTALQATHCGSSVNPYQWLYASQVAGASGYRFTIYDATGTDLLFTIDSSVSYFRFLGSAFSYGSTYQVRVQAKQGEVYGTEGSSCSITLSGIPATSINATHCGSTVTPYQWMFASQVAGATEYRFNIYDSTGTNLLFSIDRNVAYFRFFGSSFIAGTTYSVGVQAKQGGVYSTEGSRCSITLSGPPTTSIANAQCGATVLYTDAIYATAVTNATGYKFNVYDVTGTTLVASTETATASFSFSQLTGYTFDTTYQVRVQVIRGAEYGVEGSPCTITVIKEEPTRVVSNNGVIKTNMVSELTAYPNPFTTTFSITPIEGETATLFYQVYDVTGKMIESRSVEVSEITNHAIGEYYPVGMYLVMVRQGATKQTLKMVKQ